VSAPGAKLPTWYYLARAVVCFAIGALLVMHEVFDTPEDPPGPIVIVVGLTLMGFAPGDFMTFFKGK
jgi:hypothetical protein